LAQGSWLKALHRSELPNTFPRARQVVPLLTFSLEVMAILNRLVVITLLLGAAVSSSSETCKGEGPFEAVMPLVGVPTTIYDDNALLQTAVHMSEQPNLENLAEIVEELGTAEERQEASEVESGTANETTMEDVINDFSMEVGSVAAASADDAEVTVDDIAAITGERGEDMCVNCSQGDMLPSDARQRALFLQIAAKGGSYNWAGKPWEGGIVKYCFAADIALHSRLAFEKGIEQYKKGVPCLQWVNVGLRTSSSSPVYDSYTYTVRGPLSWAKVGCSGWQGYNCDSLSSISAELKANCPVSCNTLAYRATFSKCAEFGAVYVQSENDGKCYSNVGYTGKASPVIQLSSPGCSSVGTAMHEMGHTLGMAHEQSRPDRDEYVYVDFSNIPTAQQHNFKVEKDADEKRPYDVLSLMHYGTEDFAIDASKPVISIRPKGYAKYTDKYSEYHKYKPGNRVGLSQTDIEQLVDMYKDTVPGGCVGATLSGKTTCVDKKSNGQPWVDASGYGCDEYRKQAKAGGPGRNGHCCNAGGGWEVESYGGGTTDGATSGATSGQTLCLDNKETWDAGFGGCATYGPTSSSFAYCGEDCINGLCAFQVCPQCGQCS